ncbi:hypothetical protein BZG36_03570 [Bifiguratus adelaidae]|uniref:Sulfotransferase family protein n=1 Tax=Bifiguratus adelaidae TaxID=1938954 RepID=A0A261Y0E4_9FUNG|nr:hypothetical protein BZG36_03570 [Bifiguratus adelaidae]
MTIEVFCTGFGRTGTNSIKEALEILGYPCFHILEIIEAGKDPQAWVDAAEGKKVDWDAYFEGYTAVCDWPAVTFYKELIDHYPNAKIIHSVRDGEKWYESARNTIYEASTMRPSFPMSLLTPTRIEKLRQMTKKVIWERSFDNRFQDKQYAIRKMEEHTQNVLEYKGKENVLIFRVQDGWEPLCAFLGEPVPDVPFPHTNDTKMFRERIERVTRVNRIMSKVFWSAVTAGVAAVALQVAKRHQLL